MKPLHIIKIGGAVINDADLLSACLDDLSQLSVSFILVHGGGRKVDEWLDKISHEIKMVEGRRITDSITLELAVMAYAGWINKKIVSGLQARGTTALGISGADLDSIRSTKRAVQPIDFGWVGDIEKINTPVFDNLISQGISPVCCAITHDNQGQLLNTNADTIASSLSAALSSMYDVTLWYAFEKEGVLLDVEDASSVINELNKRDFLALLEDGKIHSGMKPKLMNSFDALEQGVKTVHIFSVEQIEKIPAPAGTKITL